MTMNPEDSIFIDLRTDFGFKRLFGSPERSGILIRFINALFEGRMKVTDVTFHDKEMLPQDPAGKRTVYDVYCTTESDYHFILEMQLSDSMNFPKRVLFYTAAAIVAQGHKGIDYELNPVYTVIFTNFNLKPLPKRLVNEVLLKERNSNEIYSEDMQLIFISLPQVPQHWHNCDTELEKLVYLIKNMHNMDKNSEPYRSGDYSDLFDASERGNLACDERVAYSQSYYKMVDDQAALEYSKKEGFELGRAEGMEKGLTEGMQKGLQKGLEKGRAETIAKLLEAGVPADVIFKATGIDPTIFR